MMSDSGCGCGSLKRSWTKEQQKSKRDSDRARAKTRVNLGEAFKGWRELRQRKGMKSDPQLAFFLMNSYTKREELKLSRTHTHSEHKDKAANVAEADFQEIIDNIKATEASQERAGSALSKASEAEHQTVVGVDETLHEEEKPFKFPSDPVAEQEQEQLREKRACIAYEECLRKLGTFLQLPLQKCPHVDPITKTKCGCCSPFELEISSRGTAFIMEWTCSSGHSLWKWNSQPLLQFGIQSGDFMLSSSILLSGSSYSEVSLLFKHMNMGMMVDTTLHSKQDTNTSMKEKDGLTTTEFPSDEQQLQVKEEQQEWSCSLNQEETTLQNIKEEQEEFWVKQPQGLETDANTFTFNVAEKKEDDEERLHLLQLNQRQTNAAETGGDEENCEEPEPEPEPDRKSHPENYSAAAEIVVKIDDFSETETNDRDVHSCSECGKRFSCRKYLMKHKAVHTRKKPFCCSDCGKRFTQKIQLARHLPRHSKVKRFSCSECGKQFRHKYLLIEHSRGHTGEKPYSCPDCGEGFIQKFSLTRHMLVHSGERPFSCSECGKQFKQKAHLTSHKQVHTGERPFSCSECSKSFCRKWHLNSHMLVHTAEKKNVYSSDRVSELRDRIL